MAMSWSAWLNLATVVAAGVCGAAMVHRITQWRRMRPASRHALQQATVAALAGAVPRPQQQIEVLDMVGLVAVTETAALVQSIERHTRFSTGNFERDCRPVLAAFADFVQMLPASESHHHAQPGGLWVHALEVADAALTFRAGMELPPGASTEDRKRLEHRWTFAVFAAALLHDVGKPVTDVKVLLFGDDPRAGSPWAPMAGTIQSFEVRWYSVSFGDPGERDYKAHSKLPAMLMHAFVAPRVMRWLADESDVLPQLLAYLAGDDPDGTLGSIVKRADSDSVRRNLLAGPRTRFSTARTRPLIERLMEALRRMLHEGCSLPLNRPGAAGWVYDGKVWFVCARLADEVRAYLAQHESSSSVPGKDRNDRLFDTWQEHGAVIPSPDGGAVWRVRVECDAWSPPDALTMLCFALDKLYADPTQYPAPLLGRVWVPNATGTAAGPSPGSAAPAALAAPAAQHASPTVVAAAPEAATLAHTPASPSPTALDAPAPPPVPVVVSSAAEPAAGAAADPPQAVTLPQLSSDDRLDPSESAAREFERPRVEAPLELGTPLRPKERNQRVPGAGVAKGPSAAATLFMSWVATAVGTGALKYNEEGALVHFVREGALLLSPEIFRRFLADHESTAEGPAADLRASHGERAFARLQNEVAKSGWTVRNGDENLHYYAFEKADKALSKTASFYLVGKPELFWNPVPAPNTRIRVAPRPRQMALPAGVTASAGRGQRTGHRQNDGRADRQADHPIDRELSRDTPAGAS
jgi:integrating conjugative element relaxase (TIGR03760 family)